MYLCLGRAVRLVSPAHVLLGVKVKNVFKDYQLRFPHQRNENSFVTSVLPKL